MRAITLILLAATTTAATTQAQWTIQQSNTTASLRGIHALGNGVAWASGTQGTVLHTTDDGATWQTCTTPPEAEKLDFRGIQAFDAQTAIVMSSGKGDLSRLYKTTDACKTWKLIFTNPDKDGFWDAIQFYRGRTFATVPKSTDGTQVQSINRTSGMLVGDPVDGAFAIFSTDDGGLTWNRWGDHPASRRTKARVRESLFAASNSSIISPGINGQYVFITGGKSGSRLLFEQGHSPFDLSTWTAFSSLVLPIPSSETAGAFAIGRREEPNGIEGRFVIVGGDYLKPDIGSAAFAYQPTLLVRVSVHPAQTPPHGYRSAVAYDPATKTWITVGPNGTDISTDDGKNWRALKPAAGEAPDADQNWNALSLPFVVGPKGRIGKLNPTSRQ
jgi:photosystem II stability/assembly factor-like uncharacterized protein